MKTNLPLYTESASSSLRRDGSRSHVHPADVEGRFNRVRWLVFIVLIGWLVLLPWIQIGGHPAVFLDVDKREFYLFGGSFNAQDFWLVFFPLSGVGFVLIVATALWGRVWCGYACPHTVFLEAVFRPLERLIEGPRTTRLRRNQGPWTFERLLRKTLKHTIYLLLAFVLAHVVVSYFVSLPKLYRMVLGDPLQHPTAFAWAACLTLLLYFNFSWFREQLCVIVCPYGRLQSVLADRDTVVVGYDSQRGEPRGKVSDPNAGACVDCKRCVVVCPTGIDIRNGLQIDCVGCARCIDACDDVMDKLGRARGLVRYDSLNGLEGQPKRFWRGRVFLYVGFGVAGLLASALAFHSSRAYEANLLRLQGAPPFSLDGDLVRNAFEVHLINKRSATMRFSLQGDTAGGRLQFVIAMPHLELHSLGTQRVPVFVSFRKGAVADGEAALLRVRAEGAGELLLRAPLIAP